MKAWLIGLAALTASCAGLPDTQSRREALTRQIADDAAAFNEAYAQAVSGQILLNILRSRDRLPRTYLAMTGISDSLFSSTSGNLFIGGVPLGGGGTPLGVGNIGVERERNRRPGYAVQPFDAETLTRTAFQPTDPAVFTHYWRSGWSPDLLLLVMVEAIEHSDANGVRRTFVNDANTIFEDCPPRVDTPGCAYVRAMRDFLISIAEAPRESGVDLEHGRPLCGLVEAIGPTTPVRPVAPTPGADCEPVFAIGATLVRLRLRSLDDMVYYVGELMRAGARQSVMEAQVTIAAAGLRGGGRGVPLFRILAADRAPAGVYAAEILYGGARYRAGPAISRACAEASAHGVCRDLAETGDRSSSVLSLIAEIQALNQSPEAIRAPSRLIAE